MSIAIIRNLAIGGGGGEDPYVPFSQTFQYTGNIQTLSIPATGLYKLEVYGAKGGHNENGAKGGKSVGHIMLKKSTILYIVCGGKGVTSANDQYTVKTAAGGYNGGGSGRTYGNPYEGIVGGGGGATHIALVTGLLKDIGYTDFVTNQQGLIVAGGGGGGNYEWGYNQGTYNFYGGAGGGLTGGNGSNDASSGATQTTGYAFGLGQSNTSGSGGGGGGGLYGGISNGWNRGGGGGSGWIVGVPTIEHKGTMYIPETTANVNSGDGYAIIERVQ